MTKKKEDQTTWRWRFYNMQPNVCRLSTVHLRVIVESGVIVLLCSVLVPTINGFPPIAGGQGWITNRAKPIPKGTLKSSQTDGMSIDFWIIWLLQIRLRARMTSLQYQQRKVLELPPNLVASTRQDKMSGSVRTQQQMLILPWVEVRVNLQAKIIVLFKNWGFFGERDVSWGGKCTNHIVRIPNTSWLCLMTLQVY